MRIIILVSALALTSALVAAAAEEPAEPTREDYRELRRDVEELGRDVERLEEDVDEVEAGVEGRIRDVGVSVNMLEIVVVVFSLILMAVVAVLGFRQARSVKDLKEDFEKNEEVIRRIELDARQAAGEMRTFAERARVDMERAEEEVGRAQEIYAKAEDLIAWLEEGSARAERHVKDIEEMKRVVEAAAAELPPVQLEEEKPAAIRDVLKKYPALRGYTEKLYEEAMEGDITDEDTLDDIYRTLYYTGKIEKALDVANILVERYPSNPDHYVKRSGPLIDLRRFDEALSAADEALALKPEYVPGHRMKYKVFLIMGLATEALKAAEKALALNPDDAEAYTTVGNAYNEMGRQDEALAAADRAIALQPDLHEAHATRSISLSNLGRGEEALAASERAIALDPDRAGGYIAKGWALYFLKRYEDGLACADEAFEIMRRHPVPHFIRAACLKGLGKYEDALAEVDKGVLLYPNYPGPYVIRAGIYSLLGKKEDMLADLTKAFEIYPSESRETRKLMREGSAVHWKPLGAGSDFDAYENDPDFRRLLFPEEFEGEGKS